MNAKRICGIVAIVIGVVLFLFGLHAKNRVLEVRETMDQATGMFPDNQANRGMNEMMEHRAGEYDGPILFSLIGGCVLIAGGIVLMCGCCHHKKRKR